MRGQRLLADGNAAAAAQLLRRAVDAEPKARSAREALARALFEMRNFVEAREIFASIVAENPADDYAHFGLGLAALRSGATQLAVEHLSLAVAMRPTEKHYTAALQAARGRLRPDTPGEGE